jgi:hypothetical protein
MCQVAMVRMDAGFPEERLLSGLEARGTPYQPVDKMPLPHGRYNILRRIEALRPNILRC